MIQHCGSITTNERGMQLKTHGTPLFPLAIYENDCRLAGDEGSAAWHWHDELEASVVMAGEVSAATGIGRRTFRAGEGFFINSGVLHGVWPAGEGPCLLHTVVFHARLVGGSPDGVFWQRYLFPLMRNGALTLLPLSPQEDWAADAMRELSRAWRAAAEEEPGYEFRARAALSEFVFLLGAHAPSPASAPPERVLQDNKRIKLMLEYVQAHFAEALSTADIARSAAVSERECLRCFRGTIGTPPIQYLKQYRIQLAAELLECSEQTVTEIGAACGFQEMSYFARAFRQLRGCTPSEYRRKKTGEPQ